MVKARYWLRTVQMNVVKARCWLRTVQMDACGEGKELAKNS